MVGLTSSLEVVRWQSALRQARSLVLVAIVRHPQWTHVELSLSSGLLYASLGQQVLGHLALFKPFGGRSGSKLGDYGRERGSQRRAGRGHDGCGSESRNRTIGQLVDLMRVGVRGYIRRRRWDRRPIRVGIRMSELHR